MLKILFGEGKGLFPSCAFLNKTNATRASFNKIDVNNKNKNMPSFD